MFIHPWENIKKNDSIIIDLRSQYEKESIKKNRLAYTFKKHNCDVWQDRPQLISYEKVVPQNWRPSIHYLKEKELILHIILDSDQKNVAFVFYDASTFYIRHRVTVERSHFECAMIVNESLEKAHRNPDVFYVVLFTASEHVNSS